MPNGKIKALLDARAGLAVCWLGNAGWLVRGAGKLISFDPDLTPGGKIRPAPVSAEELAPALDVVFITHEHGDHFNGETCRVLAKQSACVFVLPVSCLEKGRELGIPEARIRVAKPREPFELASIHVEPIRALHGDRHQAVYSEANLEDCGYRVTLAGVTFLQPGDSVLSQDHLALKGVDVLFVSPTDHNMRVGPACLLINVLKPKHIFPQHFDTYVVRPENEHWTIGYPDELKAALPAEMQSRFHKLAQGEVFAL